MVENNIMKKTILIIITLGLFFCKTLNDAEENNEIKKCRNALIYNLYISLELSNGNAQRLQSLPILVSYTQCLELAKLGRGKIEIPL